MGYSSSKRFIETFARKDNEIKMSVIFQVFHKNKANSRAIGCIFREKMENSSHFLSVIPLVQRSLTIGANYVGANYTNCIWGQIKIRVLLIADFTKFTRFS